MAEFSCPLCQGTETIRAGLYHPVIVHWMLNPGLVFNELVLGQVVPRSTVACAHCSGTAIMGVGRYTECMDCKALHNAQVWEGANGFGNWLGMVCPDCGGHVPRVWNFLSLLVLAVTAPLWWPLKKLFGARWRARHGRKAQARRDALSGPWPGTLGEEAPVAALRVRGALAGGRCPYCHDDVPSAEGVACSGCLARHHTECWDEHKQCAACSATTRFIGIEDTEGREPPPPSKLKE